MNGCVHVAYALFDALVGFEVSCCEDVVEALKAVLCLLSLIVHVESCCLFVVVLVCVDEVVDFLRSFVVSLQAVCKSFFDSLHGVLCCVQSVEEAWLEGLQAEAEL